MKYKLYSKELIGKATYKIVVKKGFKGVTGLKVAEQIGSSTQPIYHNFENMKDLKEYVLKMIWEKIVKHCKKNSLSDKLEDFIVEYIHYYLLNDNIYKICWDAGMQEASYLYRLSEEYMLDNFLKDATLTNIDKIKFHFETNLFVHGIIKMNNSKIRVFSKEEITKMVDRQVKLLISDYQVKLIEG